MVRQIKPDGIMEKLNEHLIDIEQNKLGDLIVEYYPYFSQPTAFESEEANRKIMTTSSAGFDQGGQDELAKKGIKYISANAGIDQDTNVVSTLSDGVVNQITSSLIGKIPGSDIATGLCDIIDSSKSTMETSEAISVSEFANQTGWGVDEFGLICVTNDIDEKPETCKIDLYPGPETEKIVESYNKYMEDHSDFAVEIGYPKDGINMSWFNKTEKHKEIYEILNMIKARNKYPLIFDTIKNYSK